MKSSVTTASFFQTAIKHGLIVGIILIIFSLVTNLLDLNHSMGFTFAIGLISILLYVFASYRAIKEQRDVHQGGAINFGTALGTGIIAAVVAGLIASIFMIVYVNYIDPSSVEQQIDMAMDMMEKLGADEDAIETAMADAEKNAKNPVLILLNGVGGALFFGLIGSLILAAVMKKEEEYS